MKLLLLPLFCLMASCAGKGTMTVTSRNSQSITVSADWRHYAGYATNSAGLAKRWFAKEATRLAQAEGQPVSAVRLESANLEYQNFPGVCIATLRGAALFGEAQSGTAFHDGSSLMKQAVSEDRRVQQDLVARGALRPGVAVGSAGALARTSQLGHRSRMHMMSMPQYTSRPVISGPAGSAVKRDPSLLSQNVSSGRSSPARSSSRPSSKKEGVKTATQQRNVPNAAGRNYTIAPDGTMYLKGYEP
jgi:hypothetical protein